MIHKYKWNLISRINFQIFQFSSFFLFFIKKYVSKSSIISIAYKIIKNIFKNDQNTILN